MADYAIYLTSKNVAGKAVLLTDGCFTDEKSCLMREHGAIFHKPRLFATAGGARNWIKVRMGVSRRLSVGKYTGPTEPWERS